MSSSFHSLFILSRCINVFDVCRRASMPTYYSHRNSIKQEQEVSEQKKKRKKEHK
jgi:hypothetical protein